MYIVYTVAQNTPGGGGRRFYLEICNELKNTKDLYASISINFYDLKKIYPEYDFQHYSFYNNWTEETNTEPENQKLFIVNHLNKCDKIIFDTEYSFFDFQTRFGNILDNIPIKSVVLVHDQFWKKNPIILKQLNLLKTTKDVLSFDPYLKLNNGILSDRRNMFFFFLKEHLYSLKNIFFNKTDKKTLNWRINQLKKTNYLFSLSQRSASSTSKLLNHKRSFANFAIESNPVMVKKDTLQQNKEFIVISYCRIAAEKNIEISMLAFSKANILNKRMIIMGLNSNPNYLNKLKRLAIKLDIHKIIEFKLNVEEETATATLLNSNVFICSDICDYNLSTYKALSLGLPVAVMAGYDFNPIISNSGAVWCKNYNSNDLAKSLEFASLEIEYKFVDYKNEFSFNKYISNLKIKTND